MIKRIDIAGIHTEPSSDVQKYVIKKIAALDRYVPRGARQSVHVEVKLKEAKSTEKKQYTCEVILHLPNETITAAESTMNMYAAIDIVEQKLKVQLKKYKDLHASPRAGRRDSMARAFLGKIRSRRV